jgi:copper chaperone CopZ
MKIDKDILPKWWSVMIWILGFLLFLGWTDLVWGQTYNYSDWMKGYGIEQHTFEIGDTITFKVSGLVCSFCAHGLNKGIGKMDYTDENNVFVDIKKQIVKVVILKEPDIEETIKVITDSGYEVSRITYKNEVVWKKEK